MKKKIILILVLIGVVGLGSWGYYHSTTATTNRAVKAVQSKDMKAVKKYLPKYSNDSKISEDAYQAFVESNLSEKQIRKILKDECKFVNNGWLGSKYWEPKKRTLSFSGLDDVDDTTASLIINKQAISLGKTENQHQDFIPGNYKLTIDIHNSAYGTVKKKENVNLTNEDQSVVFSPKSDFEKSEQLHKNLLATFSSFIISWNKSIPTMDFSNLKYATDNEKELLDYTYNEIKTILSSYENEFSKVTIDNSSIEILTYEKQPTVNFTAYVDRKQAFKLDKEALETDEDYNLASDEGTVRVKMVYSSESGSWEVEDANFDVVSEDPNDWDDKSMFVIPKDDQYAKWSKLEEQTSDI